MDDLVFQKMLISFWIFFDSIIKTGEKGGGCNRMTNISGI